jgi:hypothetical protein
VAHEDRCFSDLDLVLLEALEHAPSMPVFSTPDRVSAVTWSGPGWVACRREFWPRLGGDRAWRVLATRRDGLLTG